MPPDPVALFALATMWLPASRFTLFAAESWTRPPLSPSVSIVPARLIEPSFATIAKSRTLMTPSITASPVLNSKCRAWRKPPASSAALRPVKSPSDLLTSWKLPER